MMLMYISFVVVFVVMMIVGLFGNIFVIFVVLKNKLMKMFVNYMLFNFVVLDIFVGVFFGI